MFRAPAPHVADLLLGQVLNPPPVRARVRRSRPSPIISLCPHYSPGPEYRSRSGEPRKTVRLNFWTCRLCGPALIR